MEITKFYIAYAVRQEAYPEHIMESRSTLEEAQKIADAYLCDDDDSRVWIAVDNDWYCVWGRDQLSQRLVVSKGFVDARNAYVSEWY